MKALKRALRPVKGRIRLLRLWRGAALGLAAAALLTLIVMAASFLWPIPDKVFGAGCMLLLIPLLSALGAALWPVQDLHAARIADAHGLKERVQTALQLSDDAPMMLLQRQDAVQSLESFDVKHIHFPDMKRPILAGAAMLILSAGLFFLPNPQNAVIAQQGAFHKAMEEAAAKAEAEQLSDELSEKEKQELRKLLSDLSRELRESDNTMEALLAVSKAEERLEALRNQTAADALTQMTSALNSQGLDALAEALNSGDMQAMEQALSEGDAQAMSKAASQLSGDMQQLLSAAAQALQSGNLSSALGSLSQLSASLTSGSLSQLGSTSQLLSSLRAAAGMSASGQSLGQGMGQAGGVADQGQGSGAGQGSTNLAQGETREEQAGLRGSNAPRYNEGSYERIYDPTRLEASQTEISAQSAMSDGTSAQMQLSPGVGLTGGSVPYHQVVHEYAEAAAQAADSQQLTIQEREWVEDYFAALTEAQQ